MQPGPGHFISLSNNHSQFYDHSTVNATHVAFSERLINDYPQESVTFPLPATNRLLQSAGGVVTSSVHGVSSDTAFGPRGLFPLDVALITIFFDS
jgi:hypothetical protein